MSAPLRPTPFAVERAGGGWGCTLATGLALAALLGVAAAEPVPARVLLGLIAAAAGGVAFWLRLPTAISVGDGWLTWRVGGSERRVALSALRDVLVWREKPSLGLAGVSLVLRDGSERGMGRGAPRDGEETEAFVAALESYAVPVTWLSAHPRRAGPRST